MTRTMKPLRMLLLAPLLLVGCGPSVTPEPSPDEAQTQQSLDCANSCPAGYCEFSSPMVDCGLGRPYGFTSLETCHGTYCATWDVCGPSGPFCPI
jgi:hypothetical protein